MIRAIVTDIEGTTTSIDFVLETLFPFARRELRGFLMQHAGEPRVREQLVAVDALEGRTLTDDERIATLERWIDEDRKATPLKALQGMLWRGGYESGQLLGHVYPDVPECLRSWHERGVALYVYSSGSEEAQRLLFRHSIAGDLSLLFTGYFDTRIGHKRDASSYSRITEILAVPVTDTLYLSDVGEELDAARQIGMHTTQVVRDARCKPSPTHTQASSFTWVDAHM